MLESENNKWGIKMKSILKRVLLAALLLVNLSTLLLDWQTIEGDLIFFNTTGSGVSHVGIYIGGGKFIHASSGAGKVIESSLSEDYYSSRYVNATRVF